MPPSVTSIVETFNSKLEEPVRLHLKKVYACLALSTITTAIGASAYFYTSFLRFGFISKTAMVTLLTLLILTPHNNKNTLKRLGYLLGLSALTGLELGPQLERAISLNPSIVITALIGTTVIFVSFSICAIMSERGKWLYLGGTLVSMMSTMIVCSIANIFFGSALLYQALLYIGLMVMSAYVLYDTQMIIEKRRSGNQDFIRHALELYIDFIEIFSKLLQILSEKEKEKNK